MNYKMKTFGDQFVEVFPRIELYQQGDFSGRKMVGLALCLDCEEDGSHVPFATLTTSFGEYIGIKNCAYIDTNNYPDAGEFLQENGIAEPTMFVMRSGYCYYPLYRFNEDFLREHGGENYQTYSDQYDSYMAEVLADQDDDSGMSQV